MIYDISEGVQRKLEEYNRYERDIAEPIVATLSSQLLTPTAFSALK